MFLVVKMAFLCFPYSNNDNNFDVFLLPIEFKGNAVSLRGDATLMI